MYMHIITLQIRRLRGDQIDIFRILNSYQDILIKKAMKLKAAINKEQCRLNMRKYSFSQRVIHKWTFDKPMASLPPGI